MVLHLILVFYLTQYYCHIKAVIYSVMIIILEVISVSGTAPITENISLPNPHNHLRGSLRPR